MVNESKGRADPAEHLLLVEDNAIVGRVVALVLQRFCVVTLAATAAEAFAILERERIAIVLADFRLPDADGDTVLRRARDAQPEALRFLTSGGDIDAAAQWIAEGLVDGVLQKPFSPEDFAKLVRGAPRWGRPFGQST